DRTDGSQRLAAKAQRGDGVEILVARQLGGRVPLQRERQLLRCHAVTVVAHAQQRRTAVAQVHRDRARAGVERVLDQLLHRRGGPLHHFTGRDLVDEIVGQPADAHQGFRRCCHLASRLRASIGVRWARSSAASSAPSGSAAGANSPSCTASVASVVACPASSKRASKALARAITGGGKPARRATWIPYERSVPPACTLCRNTISSFHSRTAT